MSAAPFRVSAWLLALSCFAGSVASASERYDPRWRFRTTRTAHFDIHAHQGEEALARRLAAIAERVYQRFAAELGRPRGRVHVILVDQTDLSNGWATPFPYNAIEITAVAPPPESIIGNTTDWLEIAFTHEYTHILHLDRTRGFMQGVRRIFGRVPVAFPNAFLPIWQIEGIATYEESRLTGEGRVPAGDFRAIVDVAAARGKFEPIDRVSGGLSDWPLGHGAYAYGAYFHQFLADQYGPERLARLADRTAGRVPLFGAGAFNRVFGKPLSQLWTEFEENRAAASPPASETDARAHRLTRHGFVVTAPRVSDGTIYYAVANADGFPALMRLPPGGTPSRVAWRALGGRTSVRGEWIVFDQLERVRSVDVYADLYAVRTSGGRVQRLTMEARAAEPDLSPDGRSIVCTIQRTGRRALALVDFAPSTRRTPRVLVDDADADYGGPRWSPDGRQIVAERRRAGSYELVLIDPSTSEVRRLVTRRDARLITPSWTSDGAAVLFAADPGDASFNIFAVDVADRLVRQLTDSASGAHSPELTADGTLTYVGYTPDGYDLFSLATRVDSWTPVSWTSEEPRTAPPQEATAPDAANPRSYTPLSTLKPTYWTPILESDAGETIVGAGTAMSDVLGRHGYAVNAGWSTRARPDWGVSYAYDRWRPTLFASYTDDTDPVRGGEIRSRELFAGALVRFRHFRYSDTLLAGFDAQNDTLTCTPTCRVQFAERDLRSLRGGWLHDSRRQFGYSISSEEGFAVEAVAESSRTAFGSDHNAGAAILDVRGFQRVLGGHTVFAARAAIAASWGAVSGRRVFSAAGPGPTDRTFDFGRDTIGLLRGFAPEDVLGTRAAVVNFDLRIPLARPQRGVGTWPFFLHSLHTAAFLDVGHAWDSRFDRSDVKSSLGGELSADIVVLHYLPLTITGGTAWTRDPSIDRRRAALFARIGYAF